MNGKARRLGAALSALAISALGTVVSVAQTAEVKEKPPLYTSVRPTQSFSATDRAPTRRMQSR